MDLVIDSRWIYYPQTETLVENGRIIMEGSKIIYSGVQKDKINGQGGDYEYYNFETGITIPGMINAHTHIPMTLQRGICDNKNLQTWLEYIWSVEPKLTPEDAYWGTMLGIAEMLASGTVGFNDQYFYSNQIAKAAYQTGIKAVLAPSIFFEGNPEANSMEEAFSIAKSVHDKWHGKDKRIWVQFGPHAPYTVDRDWFETIAVEARKRGTTIHTHLNETEYEVVESKKAHSSLRPVEWMEEIGVLDIINSAAHCIHLSQNEIDLLKKYKVNVLHCPKSNAKIGSGFANIPHLLKEGVNVCLATDGQASNNKLDMFEEMAFEVLIHKAVHKDPTVIETADVLRMTTSNASSLFPEKSYSGTLEVNTPADLVVIDLNSPSTTPIIDPVSHLCHAVGREQVVMTVVNGSILYHKGNFLTLDIDKVKKEAQKVTDRLINA
ncbi:MAG: amidohydrolase [Candidatus Heimdallarchaeota archaeon]|nr:amidohydrolase [Candidatus Heimdallarchaeota archaeon]